MRVLEHIRSDIVVLEPMERVTVETVADLRDAVQRQLDAGRTHLVLNLAGVPYIDSCGLGTIAHAYVSARRRGGGLALLNVTGHNWQVLTMTRLLTVIDVFESEEDAARRVNRT